MKKTISSVMLAALFAFTGCSKDDEENGGDCRTCDVLTVSTELCDNGDGTVRVTALGETTTLTAEDLDGLSPSEYIETFCNATDLFGEVE